MRRTQWHTPFRTLYATGCGADQFLRPVTRRSIRGSELLAAVQRHLTFCCGYELFQVGCSGFSSAPSPALRLLADVYLEREDQISALRCLERVVQIDRTYQLPQYEEDRQRYMSLRQS